MSTPPDRIDFHGDPRARSATPHLEAALMLHHHRRGETTPVHAHARPHLVLVAAGVFREFCGSTEHVCEPGSLALDTGAEHHDRFESETWEVITIELAPAWLERPCAHWPRNPAISWTTRKGLEERIRFLRFHLEHPDPLSSFVIEGVAAELLLVAVGKAGARKRGAAPPWLGEIEEAVRAGFRQPPSLAELARLVDRSPSQIVREFRRWRGTTLGDLTRRLRAEHARRALLETRAALIDIAREAGYCDQSHMTRELVAYLGCTPARFRRARRK